MDENSPDLTPEWIKETQEFKRWYAIELQVAILGKLYSTIEDYKTFKNDKEKNIGKYADLARNSKSLQMLEAYAQKYNINLEEIKKLAIETTKKFSGRVTLLHSDEETDEFLKKLKSKKPN